jgi:hypothetical protein
MGSSALAHIDPLLLNNELDRTQIPYDDLITSRSESSVALETVGPADLIVAATKSTQSKRAGDHTVVHPLHVKQRGTGITVTSFRLWLMLGAVTSHVQERSVHSVRFRSMILLKQCNPL